MNMRWLMMMIHERRFSNVKDAKRYFMNEEKERSYLQMRSLHWDQYRQDATVFKKRSSVDFTKADRGKDIDPKRYCRSLDWFDYIELFMK